MIGDVGCSLSDQTENALRTHSLGSRSCWAAGGEGEEYEVIDVRAVEVSSHAERSSSTRSPNSRAGEVGVEKGGEEGRETERKVKVEEGKEQCEEGGIEGVASDAGGGEAEGRD